MVGKRWVGSFLLLALSCGRTARLDDNATGGDGPAAIGGTGSGGALAGGGATAGGAAASAGNAGQAGEAGMPECPVTPAAGQWVARGPDPYGFELASDGSHLSGKGCLGGLPGLDEPFGCSSLMLQGDRGRRVAFTWDMRDSKQASFGYAVQLELTLAPDRTAMAGTVWTSLGGLDGPGQDIVLVRYPGGPLPEAATACSGGEPSGACFLGPLRSDWIDQPRALDLSGGNLLLLWTSRRGIGSHIASARFDAETRTWQQAEFLDDGTAPVDASMLAASPNGWARVAYTQGDALLTRAYDPKLHAWSKQQLLLASDKSSGGRRPEALFVYDGGDATLLVSQNLDGLSTLSAHDYTAANGVWAAPGIIGSPGTATYEWAAASDAARNALVVWERGGDIGKPYDLWFSSRSGAGTWSPAVRFYTSDKQILNPAAAVGKNGNAIVTWHEFLARIASSSYSFQTNAWGEPATVTAEQGIQNGAVTFTEAGTTVAYFRHDDFAPDEANQKCELRDNGVWSIPVTVSAEEATGANYSVTANFAVTPLHPRAGETPPPAFALPRCEGYPAQTR